MPASFLSGEVSHDPVETAQAEYILGQEVVLGLVLCDDGEIVVVEQHVALRGLPLLWQSAHRCLMTAFGANSPIAPLTARCRRVILVTDCWARVADDPRVWPASVFHGIDDTLTVNCCL